MSSRPAKQPAAPKRSTREAIVEAAATVIAARGVRNMRVEDVAHEAEISNALLYYYFADRADLIRAALAHANEQAPTMLDDDGAAAGMDARTRLCRALMDELTELPAVRNNSIVWNEVSASATFDPSLRDALQRVTDAWNAKVVRVIHAGVDDGSIAPSIVPEDVAEHLTGLVEGLSLRWLAGTLELDRARELLGQALGRVLPER